MTGPEGTLLAPGRCWACIGVWVAVAAAVAFAVVATRRKGAEDA